MGGEVQIKPFKACSQSLTAVEIAIRVYRALNELGITTVGIYSKEDRYALFRSKADESYQLKENKGPVDAYLDIKGIIEIAKRQMLMPFIRATVSSLRIQTLLKPVEDGRYHSSGLPKTS